MIHSLKIASLVLSPFVVAMAFAVVWKYRSHALWRPRTPTDFLITGIVVGFAGKFMDNVIWSTIWAVQQLDPPLFLYLADLGSVANILTRQVPLILSAACHLHAARLMRDQLNSLE